MANNGKAAQIAKVSDFLDGKLGALETVLRRDCDIHQFISVAKSAITRNPKLLECAPATVYGALYDAAHLGLSVDPRVGEFWLIPRWNRNVGLNECSGMIGYKGFIGMAKRAGVVEHVETRVVYRDEVAQGLVHIDLAEGRVEHKYQWDGVDRRDEDIVGAYCAAWLPGVQRPAIEPLTRPELEKRMKSAQTSKVWDQWFAEMCRKSAVRALFGRGYFPLSAEVARPKKVTIETPSLTLGDALAIEDKHEAAREPLAATVTVEAPESKREPEKAEDAPQQIFEEQGEELTREDRLEALVGPEGLLAIDGQCAALFGGPWSKLKVAEKDRVLQALESNWALDDLDCEDAAALLKRLRVVMEQCDVNEVGLVDAAEEISVSYTGTEESFDALGEGDLRRLINHLRSTRSK